LQGFWDAAAREAKAASFLASYGTTTDRLPLNIYITTLK